MYGAPVEKQMSMPLLEGAHARVGVLACGVSSQAIVGLGRGGAEADSEELNVFSLDGSPAPARALVLRAALEVFAAFILRRAGVADLVGAHSFLDEGGDLHRELRIRASRAGEVSAEDGGQQLH